MTFKTTCAAAVLAAVAAASAASIASAAPKLVAGTLTCYGQGSVGAIIGSKQALNCSFNPAGPGRNARYSARISRVGVDIGVTGQSTMIWTVLASTDRLPRGALNGNFAGVSADASIVIGGGGNALVGGSNRSIVLQPVSLKGQTGLNLAIGVAELSLRQR
ncbi:MAG: DUF992 domain-containing protein [Hyphomicrobiaceae bacterium]|jgi:hypothetical protein|nr:DUF992 domain-containing protein [Hyphomicrobiaceae bacterium]